MMHNKPEWIVNKHLTSDMQMAQKDNYCNINKFSFQPPLIDTLKQANLKMK